MWISSVMRSPYLTKENFIKENLSRIYKIFKHPFATEEPKLNHPPLKKENIIIKAYSDFSFENPADTHSQIHYIVLLCNDSFRNFIDFSCKKSRKVVRFVLYGEAYAMRLWNAFDCDYHPKTSYRVFSRQKSHYKCVHTRNLWLLSLQRAPI